MLSDARAQGLSPVVCSAYRSLEYQQKLFDNQVNKQMSKIRYVGMDAAKVITENGQCLEEYLEIIRQRNNRS
jgi:hypothetical protein